jgi:predicted DNA-binding ribbon-helix-helix protein
MGSEPDEAASQPPETPAADRSVAIPAASDPDRTVQRILQVKGRRYSIRLEPTFWRVLEELADSEKIRLNVLVRRIAELSAGPAANLTSRLRVYCAEELRRRLMGALLPLTSRNLFGIAEISPAPCLVISSNQEILLANQPFMQWFGTDNRGIIGHPVARHFRFRSTPPFDEVWGEFAEGRVSAQPARIISIAPGRVRATNALLQPLAFEAQAGFVCFVWLRS